MYNKDKMIGKVYGRLTIVERIGTDNYGATWRCICTCGKEKIISSKYLYSGISKSCGCLQKEIASRMSSNRWKDHVKVTPKSSYKSTGNPVGRPAFTTEIRQKVIQLVAAGLAYREIAKILPVSIATISNIQKESSE